jgi:hypothetical protein
MAAVMFRDTYSAVQFRRYGVNSGWSGWVRVPYRVV